MLKIRILYLCLICVLSVQSVSALEQDGKNEPIIIKRNNTKQVDNGLRERINFARKLIADRNYEGATSFLEMVYETESKNPIVLNLLKQCYSNLKLNFKLEELIKKQIATDPKNMGYLLSLAELKASDGRIDEALNDYKKSASLIDGINRVRFQLLIQSMLTNKLEVQAEKYILDWRKESGDSTLLGNQMGLIYERKKEYKKAIAEYYPLLKDSTQIGNSVEKEIVELLLFEDSAPIAEEFLIKQNESELNFRAVKILSMHYIRTGQLDKSFEFTKLRDSLSEKSGNSLISYMYTCKREKLFDESIRMGNYLLSQYDKPMIGNRARFLMADAYTGLQQYDKSLQTYKTIFDLTLGVREKADALYYTGKLYQDYLGDIDSALLYYDSLTGFYKSGMSYMNALAEIPYCYVQKGNLSKAKKLFSELDSKRVSVGIQEKIYYQHALVLFIENNIDSSKILLSKLLVSYPTGFYVNDALSLLKIMQTGEDAPGVLIDYASALLFEIQRETDSVINVYNKIGQNVSKVLADFALFKISEIYIAKQDSVKALEYIDKMEKGFSDSYYFPFALKQKADILRTQNKKTDEAYEIYRHLLKDFSNYPFISEVRKILRSVSDEKSDQNS